MREAVSDIIAQRAQVTDGISRMVILSLLAHGLLLSTMILTPGFWSAAPAQKENVMVISLAGAGGTDSGGMTPITSRAVQEVAKTDPRARPAPPPEAKPEMVEATPAAKPALKPPVKPVEKPEEKSAARKPTAGAEVSKGAAVAETGSKVRDVPFGGLSTGGQAGIGGATLNVKNFCCPAYLQTMSQMILKNWTRNQGIAGKVTMRFVVQRDGRITDVQVMETGGEFLDLASRRALASTKQFPALPREYAQTTLPVELVFEYLR